MLTGLPLFLIFCHIWLLINSLSLLNILYRLIAESSDYYWLLMVDSLPNIWCWLLLTAMVDSLSNIWCWLLLTAGSTNHLPSSPLLGVSTSSDEDLDNDLRQGIDNIMYVRFPHFLHEPTHLWCMSIVHPLSGWKCMHPHQPAFRACFSIQYTFDIKGYYRTIQCWFIDFQFSSQLCTASNLAFPKLPLLTVVDHMSRFLLCECKPPPYQI